MHLRRISLPTFVVALLGLCTFSFICGNPVAEGSNWPRFRGTNGTGVSTDKDVPVEWSADTGELWKVPITGTGNSSPIVWEGKIFIESATSDGKSRLLLCIDLKDGKTLWEKSAPGHTAKTHKKNSLASCTVATDGVRVYAPSWDGTDLSMAAYDFSGNVVWTQNLGAFTSQHGAGHSPTLFDGKVILSNDQDGSSTLIAFDAETGKIAWKVERPARRACYSTPFIFERPNAPAELVVASTVGVTGYDPRTGHEGWNWTWEGNGLRTVASPVFDQGLVFVTSGDGAGNRHAVAVKVDGKGDSTATEVAWENRRTFPYVPTMLTFGDHLYFVNDRGVAACHVAKTGENVWTERLGGNFSASPVLIDGKIYAVSEEGDVYVFPAAPAFTLLAKNSIGEQVLSSPAVADSRLLIRGSGHLFCIGKPAVAK